MITILIRLITLHAENVIPEVIWGLVGVYLLMMLITLTSVWGTYKSNKIRIPWILMVVFVPFLGMFAHCLHSLTLADLTPLKQIGFFSRKLS
ncbi:MAG: hypothetical protein OJI67_05005 [Prosthecobacter sp.]|nr:hypothetical protein [Prosthecobacter sp.]